LQYIPARLSQFNVVINSIFVLISGLFMRNFLKRTTLSFCILPLISSLAFAGTEYETENLYTLSNTTQNQVYVYQRYANSAMRFVGKFETGGAGTNAGLGNQGALAFSDDKHFLFAINPGSHEVSVFAVEPDGLILLDHAVEQGLTPVSISVSGNLVYVVNTGDDSIFGFKFHPETGKLEALGQSYAKLSATSVGPAQISFNTDGDTLLVSEKNTNKLTSFPLNDQGLPTSSFSIPSSGNTPFGFSFGKHSDVFVSEAQGGAANAATVSSYKMMDDGSLTKIDGAVATNETAACWLTITPDGHTAYTADTPVNTLSAFKIDRFGTLTLLNSSAGKARKPTDLAISKDGTLLYALAGGDHTINVYKINADGSLKKIKVIPSTPKFATGLLVR
jgi:6-phosphogluconolactonase